METNCSKSSVNESPEQIIKGIFTLGKYFGYPECCINAYIEHSADKTYPYTEHVWCSPNCIESLNLQRSYKDSIKQFLPDLPPLGNCFIPLKK